MKYHAQRRDDRRCTRLRQESNPLRNLSARKRINASSIIANLTLHFIQNPERSFEQRALSASIGSKQHEHFTLPKVNGHIFKHMLSAIACRKIPNLNH
jgi:hypothetical protein